MPNSKKELTKEEKIEMKEKRRLFMKKINSLFSTQYRYSLRFEERHVFENGKAYVNVDLTKVDSPFSVYSYNNRINPEIYDYINQETWYLAVDIPVVINFDDGGLYSEEMKESISKCVIRHYSLEYEDKRMELHNDHKLGIFFLLAGMASLLAYILLTIFVFDKRDIDNVYIEILCIISWVFTWEFIHRFFIGGQERRQEVLNAGQLALVEVQFGKPKIKK